MRTLLIDNYDSFTYNLFQLIAEVNGAEPTVLRNDEPLPDLDAFDNIVISPGPGHPGRRRDFGSSAEAIARAAVPLLGVCLGHQGIVVHEGGTVEPAPQPRHGYVDLVTHTGTELFEGVPQGFPAVRYHSLAARAPLPDTLEATAWTPDGVIMGLRHRTRPMWGVQFHPESVATEFGERLLRNFSGFAARERLWLPGQPEARPSAGGAARLVTAVLERPVDTEQAFERLYRGAEFAFWLDSEHVEPGLDRFSFLGDASGPLAEVVSYDVGGEIEVVRGSARTTVHGNIFDYLREQLAERQVDAPELPFDFTCGYVGWFGYECKADTGMSNRHVAQTPDARWVFADRLVAVDHTGGRTYLVALDSGDGAAQAWLEDTRDALRDVASWRNPPVRPRVVTADIAPLFGKHRARYLADIAECRRQLHAGESYEICLTDTASAPATGAGFDLYRVLRRCNPAPYSAYLRFGDVEVACASPERFLKIGRDRTVESKPIKGTAPRGATPDEDRRLRDRLAQSPKTRAENLMIVDLLRNDLGRVCAVGSVRVPKLMAIESYQTLHQLVSTVRGTLRDDQDVIDCVRACFPPGSMTGAPKLRATEIIDSLETRARGIYSGAIGFLGLGGTADLNVVIRTAVLTGGVWTVGAGGAIVIDSDASEEYDEILLKAAAVLRAHDGLGADMPQEAPVNRRGA